ncbi:MAG: hypothetical protein V4773_22030 [Verrucomicrobiota bacterium]
MRLRSLLSLGLTLAVIGGGALLPLHAAKAPKEERVKDKERDKEKDKDKASSTSGKAGASAKAAPEAPRNPSDFEAFRIVVDRNIFNANRTSRSRATEAVAPRVETVALVGIVKDDHKLVAVFDSPDEAYRKALNTGESIAGFEVKKINPDSVELALGEKAFALRMSQQLRRVEGGEWRTTGRDYVRTDSSKDKNTSKDMPAIPSDASAVLRRLMEQRQKQLKQ